MISSNLYRDNADGILCIDFLTLFRLSISIENSGWSFDRRAEPKARFIGGTDTYNLNKSRDWREDLRRHVCTALNVLNDHAAHGVGCGERFRLLIPHIWQDCNGSIESCALLIISLLVGPRFLQYTLHVTTRD